MKSFGRVRTAASQITAAKAPYPIIYKRGTICSPRSPVSLTLNRLASKLFNVGVELLLGMQIFESTDIFFTNGCTAFVHLLNTRPFHPKTSAECRTSHASVGGLELDGSIKYSACYQRCWIYLDSYHAGFIAR